MSFSLTTLLDRLRLREILDVFKKTKDKNAKSKSGIITRSDGTRTVKLSAAVNRQKRDKKFEAYKNIKVSTG